MQVEAVSAKKITENAVRKNVVEQGYGAYIGLASIGP